MTFLSWKRTLDKLTITAREQTIEDPTPSAAVHAIAAEAAHKPIAEWMPTVRSAARAGIDSGLKLPPSCTVYGWRLCLSRTRVTDGRYSWHLSASLFPRGRRADGRDWQALGKMALHLGAPRDPTVVPEDANDAHHWQWLEQETPTRGAEA